MKGFLSQKLKEIHLELGTIDMESCSISIEETVSIIKRLEGCLSQIRTYFLSVKDICKEDEMIFFKEIKHEILRFLLYFNKMHAVKFKQPNGSNETLANYYQQELNRLTCFFDRNLDLYQYYRSKATHLDEHSFIRDRGCHQLFLDRVHVVIDSEFSTGYDYKIAEIICNEIFCLFSKMKIPSNEQQILIDLIKPSDYESIKKLLQSYNNTDKSKCWIKCDFFWNYIKPINISLFQSVSHEIIRQSSIIK